METDAATEKQAAREQQAVAVEVSDDDEELAVRLKAFVQSESNPNCKRAVVFECTHRYTKVESDSSAAQPEEQGAHPSSSSDGAAGEGPVAAHKDAILTEAKLRVRYSNCTVSEEEMRNLVSMFEHGREYAIRKGMVVDRTQFEVHQYHPPIIYGRTTTDDPEKSEGIVICQVERPQAEQADASLKDDTKAGLPPSDVGAALGAGEPRTFTEKREYCVLTYAFPAVTARFVPSVLQFCHESFGLPLVMDT
mmetsp:Transcript_3405/g.12284  ORF Transcript_3405/g.12284 Transcript_3405/m.12284 type:complete len:250 (+) Transcript_3405:128-877(+)